MALELKDAYRVMKVADINLALTSAEKYALRDILNKLGAHRAKRGAASDLPCLVVEADWPEYDGIKGQLLMRFEREGRQS